MKTLWQFLNEGTYVIHGQAGGKFHTHEIEARSHDHAKTLYKKKMKEMGHKYATLGSVRTRDEESEHKRKSDEFLAAREKKIAATHAEMDKNKDYWDAQQKAYDSLHYKGD